VRWLQVCRKHHRADPKIADWATTALAEEQARIANALSYLEAICNEFYSQAAMSL